MKALEKDRARRYDSPNALAADIQRYLDDEPVLASPPSVMYRAQKFVRRHRIAVLGAATVGVMLIVLAVSMTVQAIRIAHERDRANREAVAAKSVSDFLTGLFKVSDPSQARGNTITAREILDKGSKQIETSLSGQPEVQARLMATIGNVYQSLGLYPEAQPLLEKALATRQKVLGPHNPETLGSMDDLAGTLRSEGRSPTRKSFCGKHWECSAWCSARKTPPRSPLWWTWATRWWKRVTSRRPKLFVAKRWPSSSASLARTIPILCGP